MIAKRFGNIVRCLLGMVKASNEQSKRLATARDTLLPKLLSGELGIKDAERIAGGTP